MTAWGAFLFFGETEKVKVVASVNPGCFCFRVGVQKGKSIFSWL